MWQVAAATVCHVYSSARRAYTQNCMHPSRGSRTHRSGPWFEALYPVLLPLSIAMNCAVFALLLTIWSR